MPSPTLPLPGTDPLKPGFGMLQQAMGDVQRLLAGKEGRRRWGQMALLCVMAGVVGVGAAPPPLGLLPPLWGNPEIRGPILGSPTVVVTFSLLVLVLVLFGAVARAFTFGFIEGLVTGQPQGKAFREYLNRATLHYVWSSVLTLPLYALLFLGEAVATHDVYTRFGQLLANPPEDASNQATALLLEGVLKFGLVLLPWTLLTLPLFVLMYELTPAAMWLYHLAPVAASGRVLQRATAAPRAFWSYLGLRYLLQLAGNTLAGVALLPSLLISAIPAAVLIGIGWGIAVLCGGPSTPGGIAALTTTILLAVVVLYCVLCTLLTPVSAVLYRLAIRLMQ